MTLQLLQRALLAKIRDLEKRLELTKADYHVLKDQHQMQKNELAEKTALIQELKGQLPAPQLPYPNAYAGAAESSVPAQGYDDLLNDYFF